MSERAEAAKPLVEPKAVKSKMPRDLTPNSAVLLSLGSRYEAIWPRVVGSDNQSPRFKPGQRLELHPAQAPRGA